MVFSGFEDAGVVRSDGSILWGASDSQDTGKTAGIAGFKPMLNYLPKTKNMSNQSFISKELQNRHL